MTPRVKLEYEIKVKGGEVIESSADRGPLDLVLGQRRLLPALEERIAVLREGEEAAGEIPAAEAFGNEALLPVAEVPRSEFPEGEPLEVGRTFEAKSTAAGEVRFRIVGIGEALVKVKFLHPLADKDLEYKVRRLPLSPPPPPARAIGIDSTAIVLEG